MPESYELNKKYANRKDVNLMILRIYELIKWEVIGLDAV